MGAALNDERSGFFETTPLREKLDDFQMEWFVIEKEPLVSHLERMYIQGGSMVDAKGKSTNVACEALRPMWGHLRVFEVG